MVEIGKDNTAVKMQKLRRAIDRVRNVRSGSEDLPIRKQSLLSRIAERLGIRSGQQESES
ncbi:MAG: hypothetical protein JW981_08390 [Anaerolineae bacterium]|nr:hypothetical protein [Anaerolineae bacterium]